MSKNPPSSKVFISYSWTSPGHCDLIRSYAERLRGDGIDVILDQWDLSEGQDKYAFMEKMVTDPSVTHVLVFSDRQYAEKANTRKAGVGTESQIMSKEIYDKVDQKKFIPIVCERKEGGEPYLPTFFAPRISIDFNTPERVNENWEQLIRALYGKPLHTKPALGNAPSYILSDETVSPLPTKGKYATLRDAILNGKPTLSLCRDDFLNLAISYADTFRVRKAIGQIELEDKILNDLRSLLPLRDQFIDWMLLESSVTDETVFEEVLIGFLERILALKYHPPELVSLQTSYFDAHAIFAYEIFLYAVATLVRSRKWLLAHTLLVTNYMLPESEIGRNRRFAQFNVFYSHSQALTDRIGRLKLNRISPVADLMKERSTRTDITFQDIMQSDLILFLKATISDFRWYPQTLIYASYEGIFPIFARATQHKHFEKVKIIFGISSADELREKFKAGCERLKVDQWHQFTWNSDVSFANATNLDALDTLQ